MNTTNWIKITDRAPEFPAWVHGPGVTGAVLVYDKLCVSTPGCYTHWQPAQIPAPPPREMTQAEKDAAEYVRWHNMQGDLPWPCDAWHAALRWEREGSKTP